MDGITLTQLLTILGLVLGIISFVAGIVWKLWQRVIQNGRDLSDYKLVVAKEYVNSIQLTEMEKQGALREQRFHDSMENLTKRIDRILDRLDRP